MKGQWIIKEVYFEDGFPKIIRDLKPETPDTEFTDEQELLERFSDIVAAHEREQFVAIVLDNSDAEGICCTDDVLEALRQRGEK
jgi:hypothetical protein